MNDTSTDLRIAELNSILLDELVADGLIEKDERDQALAQPSPAAFLTAANALAYVVDKGIIPRERLFEMHKRARTEPVSADDERRARVIKAALRREAPRETGNARPSGSSHPSMLLSLIVAGAVGLTSYQLYRAHVPTVSQCGRSQTSCAASDVGVVTQHGF